VFGKSIAYMPFFAVGVILRENGKLSKMAISADWGHVVAPLVMFSLVYVIRPIINIGFAYGYPGRLFLGVVGSLVVINISHTIGEL
jgi:hypothetical protein